MLEELQRRNYSPNTIRPYLFAVEDFARYFGKSPDQLGQEHLRQYQLHLVNDRKLTVETIAGRISALRFFFVKVLRRPYRRDRSGLSETARAIAGDFERGGSGAADRVGQHLLPSRDSDDVVRNGIAPRGTVPIEADRHR